MIVREAMVTSPVTIEPSAQVFEAARLMRDKQIGSVIVVENGKVLGIATERDLIRRVMATNRDPKKVKISEVMTAPVISISPNEDVIEAAQLMSKKGVRRLVVMDKEMLIGVITTNDLSKNMTRAVEELATSLYLIESSRLKRESSS
ncbi:MAG: CBS domain-containing protein [Candidatus Bathyarchaeota archaeon]|nr:MAG: CBS domain-containing protein [Candidatus Bathyarchaeota archaeon]